MKRRRLIRHLEKEGCEFPREGSKHTLYINRKTGKRVPIPRHSEVKDSTAREIRKQLEIGPVK